MIFNIIAIIFTVLSISTVKAQNGLCNDFRTGVSEDYARMMTIDELVKEYENDEFKMKELITLLQWHNIMRGWGFDKITREDAIKALKAGEVRKASGKMIVARICDGKVEWFPRMPKLRFGGEDVLYITVRGEDIEIASLDCANLIWDKHDVSEEGPRLTETTTDTSTSKGGNASAVATATASVGDINITTPPPVTNNNYIGSGGSNYGGGYSGYYGASYGYNSYGGYGSYGCYGCGVGIGVGVRFGPLGLPIPYLYGYNNCNSGYSCGGNQNFTPSSYTNNYYTNNYYGNQDPGDINIDIDIVNNNINNNHNVLTWVAAQASKPDGDGPVDPPSGDDGNPVDPGSGDTGNGTDPGSGDGPVDPGSGKTDETTAHNVEMFKGSFETKSLSVNTNKKVADQQQLSSKKSFETGPSAFAMNSKVNANKNNEVFAKQTQLESYTKSFQTETASKIANQALSSDAKSKFTISNSGKQQNTTLSKTAPKEQPRTLKEFSAMALQNKQVSNDQQNMSLASKTAAVHNDVNQRNGQQSFQNSMSARGNDVQQNPNQSFNRNNETLQKGFNVNGVQNQRIDNGNNFQRNENFGLSKRTGNQNPAPQMNFNQQPQQRNFVSAPPMQRGGGNMMMQQAPPMMRNGGGNGLAKAGHR